MSNWSTEREAFRQVAVCGGIASQREIDRAFPLGHTVPPSKLVKWLSLMQEPPKDFHTGQRQYVNRFKLGADPEFMFLSDGQRVSADSLGLKQGPAFGADNNGRLAEIRPYPSRSALEVVASILSTLRWMTIMAPGLMQYDWVCGAYILQDGLGGHVHFGRKRPTRRIEVAALDRMVELLLDLGVYSRKEVELRRRGDARGQHYGLPGDIRLQTHGYEYRTWPSWLDSPELAFLAVTLSKLAVYNPPLCRDMVATPAKALYQLKNLLGYYQGVDDDARLARYLLEKKGIPVHRYGDFKNRWGITGVVPGNPGVQIVPLAIKPSKEMVDELFEYLMGSGQLAFRVPVATWPTTTVPKGYQALIDITHTVGMKGLGELIWDICIPSGTDYRIMLDNHSAGIVVSSDIAANLPKSWQKAFGGIRVSSSIFHKRSITIGDHILGGPQSNAIKAAITCGWFPFWRVKDVLPTSFEAWRHNKKTTKNEEFDGKVLYGGELRGVFPA